MRLSEQEQSQINELVADVEAKSGAQVVVAVIGKADAYPEIPWKAFALGTAVAALLVILDDLLHPNWASLHSAVFDVVVILGAGAACGLAAIFAPPFARLFLDRRFHLGRQQRLIGIVVELELQWFFRRGWKFRGRRFLRQLVNPRSRDSAYFLSLSRNFLRNFLTFGATTTWQYG